MTNSSDDELLEWQADWQTDPEPAPEVRNAIRRRVRRQSLKMALATAGEMTLGLGMLVFVIRVALRDPTPLNAGAMASLGLLILWAMGCSLWYLRGTWKPGDQTTSAFITLSLLRAHRRLRALRAGWLLLVLELAVMIPWIYFQVKPGDYALLFGYLAFLTALVMAGLIWGERRARRELREWEALRANLNGS